MKIMRPSERKIIKDLNSSEIRFYDQLSIFSAKE